MEETITMTEILARIVRSWKKIGCVALVVAVLLGGFQGYRMVSQAKSPNYSPEAIEARYQTALEEYELQKKNLETNLTTQEEALAAKKEYAQDSILMAIDPYNEYVTSIVLAFTNISGEGAVQGASQYQQTGADYLVQTIRSQYVVLWQSIDLAKDLKIEQYEQVQEKYLSEVVSVTNLDGGLLSIRAVGNTANETEQLASAVYQYFMDHQATIAQSSYAHNISVVSQSTKNLVDDSLVTKHQTLETEIQSLEDTIESLNTQLDELVEPQKEAGFSTSTIIKSVLKYTVLGAVLGIVLACFWICCLCVFGSRISSSRQAEQLYHMLFLGSLKIPHNVMERFSASLANERVWRNKDQAVAYLSQQVKAQYPQGGDILVLSTLSSKQAKGVEALESALTSSGYTVSAVLDATHNPDSVQAIHKSNAVILAESLDATRMWEMRDLTSQVRSADKQLLGFVML